LPEGYRAYLGSTPEVAIGTPRVNADMSVVAYAECEAPALSDSGELEPDTEVEVTTIQTVPSLFIERHGWLVAVVELVSPRNKDRDAAREKYALRYAAYLLDGVHLMLIDVHARPSSFSFVRAVEETVEMPNISSLAPPLAVSYRVGEPAAAGGSYLAVWHRQLAVGKLLPKLPLPLTPLQSITVELEATYMEAAADVYLA
jgi:hypothetical protein